MATIAASAQADFQTRSVAILILGDAGSHLASSHLQVLGDLAAKGQPPGIREYGVGALLSLTGLLEAPQVDALCSIAWSTQADRKLRWLALICLNKAKVGLTVFQLSAIRKAAGDEEPGEVQREAKTLLEAHGEMTTWRTLRQPETPKETPKPPAGATEQAQKAIIGDLVRRMKLMVPAAEIESSQPNWHMRTQHFWAQYMLLSPMVKALSSAQLYEALGTLATQTGDTDRASKLFPAAYAGHIDSMFRGGAPQAKPPEEYDPFASKGAQLEVIAVRVYSYISGLDEIGKTNIQQGWLRYKTLWQLTGQLSSEDLEILVGHLRDFLFVSAGHPRTRKRDVYTELGCHLKFGRFRDQVMEHIDEAVPVRPIYDTEESLPAAANDHQEATGADSEGLSGDEDKKLTNREVRLEINRIRDDYIFASRCSYFASIDLQNRLSREENSGGIGTELLKTYFAGRQPKELCGKARLAEQLFKQATDGFVRAESAGDVVGALIIYQTANDQYSGISKEFGVYLKDFADTGEVVYDVVKTVRDTSFSVAAKGFTVVLTPVLGTKGAKAAVMAGETFLLTTANQVGRQIAGEEFSIGDAVGDVLIFGLKSVNDVAFESAFKKTGGAGEAAIAFMVSQLKVAIKALYDYGSHQQKEGREYRGTEGIKAVVASGKEATKAGIEVFMRKKPIVGAALAALIPNLLQEIANSVIDDKAMDLEKLVINICKDFITSLIGYVIEKGGIDKKRMELISTDGNNDYGLTETGKKRIPESFGKFGEKR